MSAFHTVVAPWGRSRLIVTLLAAVVLSATLAAQRGDPPWHRFTWFAAQLGDEHVARLAIHVPASLEGLAGEHRLQLDTGASHTVLHGGALRHLSPTFAPAARAMTVSGTIAGVAVANEPVGLMQDFQATVMRGTPAPIVGSLGLSFFAHRILVLDYPGERFMVLPKGATLPDRLEQRAQFLPATLRNGKLYVPVSLDGHARTDVFFDTGASAFAFITSPERWRALTGLHGAESSTLRRTGSSWDTDLTLIGGRMRGALGVGPAGVTRPVVWHTPDSRFSFSHWPDTSGFIGNEIFADRFIVILDLSRGRFGIASHAEH
ncbi:hypothetical protein [Luteitalea sp.]